VRTGAAEDAGDLDELDGNPARMSVYRSLRSILRGMHTLLNPCLRSLSDLVLDRVVACLKAARGGDALSLVDVAPTRKCGWEDSWRRVVPMLLPQALNLDLGLLRRRIIFGNGPRARSEWTHSQSEPYDALKTTGRLEWHSHELRTKRAAPRTCNLETSASALTHPKTG
jgi:hypothetical protein